MWRRFFGYGVAGWLIEVVMTGVCSVVLDRDGSAKARTYLWMLPVYGTGGLLLESMSARLRDWPRSARALAYVPFIYGVEYTSGWILRRVLRRCPWDYGCPSDASRLVRADYAPLWFIVALMFEPLRDGLRVVGIGAPPARAEAGPPEMEAAAQKQVAAV